jgi:hypothetical protein
MKKMRFALGNAAGLLHSNIWSIKTQPKGDVYICSVAMKNTIKISLHASPQSGHPICRLAQVVENSPRPAMSRWLRNHIPNPASAAPDPMPVQLIFPADETMPLLRAAKKPTRLIPAAPPGKAVYVSIVLTRRPRAFFESHFGSNAIIDMLQIDQNDQVLILAIIDNELPPSLPHTISVKDSDRPTEIGSHFIPPVADFGTLCITEYRHVFL